MVFMTHRSVLCQPIVVECRKDVTYYCIVSSPINMAPGDTFYFTNLNRTWDSVNTIIHIQPQQRSYIASIDSIFDYLPALQQLFISNSLNELPSMQFTASTLRLIDFRQNFIQKVKKSAFDGAVNLQYIDLTDNLIYMIENEAFSGLNHLTSIRMANNELGSLLQHTFAGAESLRYINLRNNSITTIAEGCFALKNLEELILAENHLEMLTATVFNGSERLKKVSLAHNLIKVVNVIALASSAPIETLSFEDNQLGRYEKQTINCTTTPNNHLKHLSLAKNQLQNTEILNSLKCLKNLETLNLNGNNFTKFANISALKVYFPHLIIIHLIDNKISCDWLKQTTFDTSLIYTRSIRYFSFKQIVCVP